jgi:hypothetical protein
MIEAGGGPQGKRLRKKDKVPEEHAWKISHYLTLASLNKRETGAWGKREGGELAC